MAKLFSFRKPTIRISKKGKIGFSPGSMRVGGRNAGVNFSKRGVSASGGVRGARLNSRQGATLGCPLTVLLVIACIAVFIALTYPTVSSAYAAPLAQATAIAPKTATALKDANLRGGPGTTFAVVGGVKAGQALTITGQNAAGDWYQLEGGQWIAAFLVKVGTAPVATATKGTTPQEALAYINALRPILTNYSTALTALGTQMTAASEDMSLIQDEDWRLETAVALGALLSLAEDVRALTPPPALAAIHSDVLAAAEHYENAANLVADGIDQLDIDLIVEGSNEMTLGGEAIKRAQAKMLAAQATPTKQPTVAPTTKATTLLPTPTPNPPTATPAVAQPTATPVPPTATPVPTLAPPTATPQAAQSSCDPSYPSLCIPPGSPDLDCGDIDAKRFPVVQPDPHGFDRDKDGIGCES